MARALGGVFGVVVGVGAFSCGYILLIDRTNLNSNLNVEYIINDMAKIINIKRE